MGIISGLFRSRDKPQNRTTGNAYAQIIRNGKAYPSISHDILKGVFVGFSTKKYHHGRFKP